MKPWQHETGSENEVVWGGWARNNIILKWKIGTQ